MVESVERAVDVAIVGAGSAGLAAYRAVSHAGATAVVIDRGPFGTTCARVGCMPSKLLIAAAYAAFRARAAQQLGVRTCVEVDDVAVLQRVRAERDRFVGAVIETIERARSAGELLQASAQIESASSLHCSDGSRVRFRSLVLATGSRPSVLPAYRAVSSRLLTNEDIFELEQLPKRLLVVGAGVLGLELGQALGRLGVQVTVLGANDELGPLSDPAMKRAAEELLSAELDLHLRHALHSVELTQDGVQVGFADKRGERRTQVFDRVLMAAGRAPDLGGLELERLGVSKDANGRYPIDPATLQLGALPVFVAGDCNALHPLLHEAVDDGHLAGQNAARYPDVACVPRRAALSIVFTDPQIAVVGQRFTQARSLTVGEVDFADQGRARVQGQNHGKLRIYAEPQSQRLLGAELFAPQAEHLAHLLAWAVQLRLCAQDVLALPFYHPVLEEGLRTALRRLSAAERA